MTTIAKAVQGAAWNMASGVGSRAVGLVGTLILTHYLLPSEFGEVSAASVIVTTANQFSTLGFGQYLIANRHTEDDAPFHATFYHLLMGVAAVLIVVLLRHPLGRMVEAPQMSQFVPGLALAMMMSRIAFVPERLLARSMRFRSLAIVRGAGELIYTAVSVALAYAGWGGMAVVMGNIARSLFVTSIRVFEVPWRAWLAPHRLSWPTTRQMCLFGLPLAASAAIAIATRRWDNLFVSHFFGPAVMGAYAMAYNLAETPATFSEFVGDVLLPSFARMTPEERRRSLFGALRVMSLVSFPLAIGLGAIAPTVVESFLYRRWSGVASMLVLLCAISVARSITGVTTYYLQAINRTGLIFLFEILRLLLFLGLLATLGRLGPLWACALVGAVFLIHALASTYVIQWLEGLPKGQILEALAPPLIACIPMVLAVLGIRYAMHWTSIGGRFAILGSEIVVGGLVYTGAALVVAPRASGDIIRLVREAIRRRRDTRAQSSSAG